MPATATRRRLIGSALAGTALAAAPRARAETAPQSYTLPFSAVLPFTSAVNGIAYALYVRTPADYAMGDARYPVIVTLDADYSFTICANHLEHLADRADQGPKAILVSIAYPGIYPDRDGYRAQRTRDYTPIFWPDGGYGPEFQKDSGGGPLFQRVIAEEVLPTIDRLYRTDPIDRTLVGHSYGGLFAAWTLQTRPELFSRYLMVSPSLWYARKKLFADEAAGSFVKPGRKTFAYLAVGSWEEQPERDGFMVSEMQAFAEALNRRGDPGLTVKARVFEDETHASIFPAAFSTGIRHLFRTMG